MLGAIAVFASMTNIVSGFLITDRMLKMFKEQEPRREPSSSPSSATCSRPTLFIFSLRWLNHPKTARRGVFAGVAGMAAAVVGTLLHPEIVSFTWIAIAMVAGTLVGVPLSRVPLTAVPQRTALSHAFGGLAAGLVGTAKYCHLAPGRRAHAVPHRRASSSR